MKISDFAIAAIWIYLLVDSWRQGLEIPELMTRVPLPVVSVTFISILLSIVFLISVWFTFWQRHSVMEKLPLITGLVDGRYGKGTYSSFMHRLRPIGISTLSGGVLGSVGAYSTYTSTQSQAAYLISGVFLTVALGLLVALLISLRYPPTLR